MKKNCKRRIAAVIRWKEWSGNPLQCGRQSKLRGRLAASDLPVLIVGETGTGKEVFAHAIHLLSFRGERPLVRVNCAAIPNGRPFESELFGYEAGAFTGANPKGKPGKFELADKSTISPRRDGRSSHADAGEAPASYSEHGEVERVGGTRALKVDFRVIAATNREPQNHVSSRGIPKRPILSFEHLPPEDPSIETDALRHSPARVPPSFSHSLPGRPALSNRPGGNAAAHGL